MIRARSSLAAGSRGDSGVQGPPVLKPTEDPRDAPGTTLPRRPARFPEPRRSELPAQPRGDCADGRDRPGGPGPPARVMGEEGEADPLPRIDRAKPPEGRGNLAD